MIMRVSVSFNFFCFIILSYPNIANNLKTPLNPGGPELSHFNMEAKFRNANNVVTK
jgi:hypothetical protein